MVFFNLRRFLPQKHRQVKKFALHCNRCTVVTRFINYSRLINLGFVRIQKEGTLGTRLNRLIFLLQIGLEEIFQMSKTVWKTGKTYI